MNIIKMETIVEATIVSNNNILLSKGFNTLRIRDLNDNFHKKMFFQKGGETIFARYILLDMSSIFSFVWDLRYSR